METNYAQQEILLLTGTTLAAAGLYKSDETGGKDQLTAKERLEEACWNGMLRVLLPEVYLEAGQGRSIYLWQVRAGESFLELNLGEVPLPIDRSTSIMPHYFFPTLLVN